MNRLLSGLFILVAFGGWGETLVDHDAQGQVTRIREFRDGVAVWDVVYANGFPRTETLLKDGQPSEVALLDFSGNNLVRRTVKDAQGALVYQDTLFRWPNGSLRRLERDGPEGPLANVAWSYDAQGHLVSAWTADPDQPGTHREWQFSPTQTREALVRGTEVVLDRVSDWLAAGRSMDTLTEPTTSVVTVRKNDDHGRPLEETVTSKGTLVRTRSWTYDGDGRVTVLATVGGSGTETWRYTYAGTTTVATVEKAGLVVREETRTDGDLVTVKYFDQGSLFLVETWAGGKKTKETYYQKGAIVRERTP